MTMHPCYDRIVLAARFRLKSTIAARRSSLLFTLMATLLTILTGVVSAQDKFYPSSDLESRPFWANVLYFRSGEGEKTLTEVFVEIPYATLAFVRTSEGYEAGAEVGVVFEDDSGFQTDGDAMADVVRVEDLETTRSKSLAHLFYLPFRVEPGSYTLRLIVEDTNTGSRLVNAFKINVPSFRCSQVQISSLQLARNIKFSEIESPLRKSGRLIIPNVPHLFSFEKPVCFLYFEAYNLASQEGSFQVQCRISRFGKEVRTKSWNIPNAETKVAISLPLDLKDLVPGEYLLTISVVDQDGKRQASAVAMFSITRSIA